MAVVSHPALSPEWSFPSPVNPYDAATFSPHIELPDHTPVHQVPAVVTHKRRAHEIEWDDDDTVERVEARVKKPKTSDRHSVDPHQLHRDIPSAVQAAAVTASPPQIEQVISILVDALTSTTSTSPTKPSSQLPESPLTVLSSNVPTTSPAPPRTTPTSPLSNCPNRAPYVRKVIGGSCAGRTEGSLYRWVLCKNHFLRVRCLDPMTQNQEWIQTLHEMGWEELHPFYQAQAAAQSPQTFGTLNAFSRWIEDDFDYDGTEDADGEWSDEEDEDGEMHDDQDMREDGAAQRDVWDSGVVLQLPGPGKPPC